MTTIAGLDLSDEIQAICQKMGVDHDKTRRLVLEPGYAVAEVLDVDAEGRIVADDFGIATHEVCREVAKS